MGLAKRCGSGMGFRGGGRVVAGFAGEEAGLEEEEEDACEEDVAGFPLG